MELASAYPDPDISAGAMAAIAVVMVAVLAIWLAGVYLAARTPRGRGPAGQAPRLPPAPPVPRARDHAAVTAPGDLAEDEHRRTALTG